MSNEMISRLRFLIKKRRAQQLSYIEEQELIEILGKLRKDDLLSSGQKVATALLLATLIGGQKPKELTT